MNLIWLSFTCHMETHAETGVGGLELQTFFNVIFFERYILITVASIFLHSLRSFAGIEKIVGMAADGTFRLFLLLIRVGSTSRSRVLLESGCDFLSNSSRITHYDPHLVFLRPFEESSILFFDFVHDL